MALQEQPLAVKLELLYRKELFSTALALLKALISPTTPTLTLTLTLTLTPETLALLKAQPHDSEPALLADIHRRHAEHLYAKGDYDGAVDAWVLTLGEVTPNPSPNPHPGRGNP